MPLLNKWWYTEYAEEIVITLREREVKRTPFYQQSPQFKYRSILVAWMRSIAEDLHLNNAAIHLAVYLLDIFMDNHRIEEERLNFVALVCILLAAKTEERDANVPKISELNTRVGNQYPATDFISLEFMVMHFFHWNLVIPTAAHFAEYFTVFATSLSDMNSAPPQFNTYPDLRNAVQQYIRDFLDLSLQEVCLIPMKPSFVAAVCIAAARQFLHMSPKWPDVLENVTMYQYKDLQPCVMLFISFRDYFQGAAQAYNGYFSFLQPLPL
ncbi:cyclin-J-like isoform X2 [Periplaneta americana]|uniref:cyclin-J-like isoform X2 n=1 Tax=Periplaneta americana TaxID=6978 RepID=UPI0037E7CD83